MDGVCAKLLQRVVICFATDREVIEKSKILHNKGSLASLYCPLVCPEQFKCIFTTFVTWPLLLFFLNKIREDW